MKKVLAINSSRRMKNTYSLIKQIKEHLNKHNIEVEIINLYDLDIKDCIGCEHCILKGICVLNDDTQRLMEKINNSDGVILTSPVYLMNVTGKLKTFVDRTCKWFHRPEVIGKPFLVVSTTKGSGLNDTLDYMQKVVTQWGGFNAGRIGRNVRNIETPVTENECKRFIEHLTVDKKDYKPSLNSLMNYQVQRALSLRLAGLDKLYWQDKGWTNKIYYFDCKINIFKRGISALFYKIMSNALKVK